MTREQPIVSVIVCAHNEEKYVGKCLASVRRALKNFRGHGEVVFVADRCTDGTVEIAKKYKVEKLIVKKWKKWRNSYAESLQTGLIHASGEYVSIVDADIVLPEDFYEKMLPLLKGDVVSVSAMVETYPSTLINSIYRAWERTHELTPLGREPRGAARIVLGHVLREVGGFSDVPAPDTDLDIKIRRRGYKSIYYKGVRVWHIREISPKKVVSGQISSGVARYYLNVGFMRTLGHSVFRLRPFVVGAWVVEWLRHRFG
ncbi:MAG: glycosyltransferase [Thaumarchaeota archaeon]|jgi:glycosyltransferase involved in cell wall biosynthesis|nr:glycosyltransferase [Nitrososphaerota archaeon]